MDPVHMGIAIIATAVAASGIAWRIGAWMLNRIEKSIGGVDEKLSRLDERVGDLSNSIYELKGEVKGRAYAEMEQFVKELQKGER